MSRTRYEGLQNELIRFIPESCFFLSLLSVAEDYRADRGQIVKVDFIDAFRTARERGWLGIDNMMYSDVALLEYLTGHTVDKRIVKPEQELNVLANEYTIAKYRKGAITHFRRRGYDVYNGSQTVAKGKLDSVYVYKFI